jgi:hypothetical protein
VIPVDLSQAGAALLLVKKIESENIEVEMLVNNAGFGLLGPFIELDADGQSEMIRLNVMALTELTRLLIPAMVRRGKGKILNVASTAAFQPGPLMAVYFATKSYVFSFSVALNEELQGTGVTVTCLCPGATDTRFAETARAANSKLFRLRKPMSSMEVAEAAYRALQKKKAFHVTGGLNRLMTLLVRLAPVRIAAKVARAMMEKSTT